MREGDINKEKRGIAIQRENSDKEPSKEKCEGISIGRQLKKEIEKQKERLAALLVAMDKDWNLRLFIEEVLKDKRRETIEEDTQVIEEEERVAHKRDIMEKTESYRKKKEERRREELQIELDKNTGTR